jgi:hypothetical protein
MRKLSAVLLVIIAITVIVIAALLRPDRLSDFHFWLNIGWILFLVLLNWGTSTYTLFTIGEGRKDTLFGAVPSISISVFIYSLISLSLLFVSWNVSVFADSNWHLVTQIAAFSVTSVICVLMFIAARAATISGSEGVPSKEELIRCISGLIERMSETEKNVIQDLKEIEGIIRYSMPHVARLHSKENYNKLFSEVTDTKIHTLGPDDIREKVQSLKVLAKSC